METSNYELKRQSREHLTGNWGLTIGTFLGGMLITSTASAIPIVNIFVSAACTVGLIIFSLNLLKDNAQFEDAFKAFPDILRLTGASFLIGLFAFLWSLLFLIPGIIKAYSYSMTLYIMSEDLDIYIMDAIEKSRHMMNGFKMKLFLLELSFIGWGILCLFTLGIGFLWLVPYVSVAKAAFYNDIKTINGVA
jgi:uncharacterized membrane protein